MAIANLTAARLRELLIYDPLTGIFTWRETRGSVRAGKRAGCAKGGEAGYIVIRVDGKLYRANRLAWLYMTGEWPKGDVDHEDGNPKRNVWTNLRDGSHQFNLQNRRKANPNKVSGLPLGVISKDGKYVAQISRDGLNVALGRFVTPEEAHAAYVEAKRLLHEGCTL